MDGNYDPNQILNMSGYINNSSTSLGSSYSSAAMMQDATTGYGGVPNLQSDFQVSEFFELDDWMEDDQTFVPSGYDTNPSHNQGVIAHSGGSSSQNTSRADGGMRSTERERKENKEKVAFKTKSEVEILDDGFKWRKYGKKMVKNSPNPRNYYRCSIEGCPVKKRVERDKEDPRYVITTYEGIHNHQGPSLY